ncbi:Cytosol aminopeptidase [Rickettsiales endosymbiont of Paramecium tredecaurelia]|uniref:leucyl aminopeptidase n=1 Tax=Candidatus Sarmatiella mevalonica TaxID=2770581 RepID=UPI001923A309|nr:leucyl aminopeptidase [Candidatus Sarmatiella mevalonica]MBL3284241.1 Cytosol aminopeptidase [Candidatus Sarmatiella mevalonica]
MNKTDLSFFSHSSNDEKINNSFNLEINFIENTNKTETAHVLFCDESLKIENHQLSKELLKLVDDFLLEKRFCAKFGEVKCLNLLSDGLHQELILIGIGCLNKITKTKVEQIGGAIFSAIKSAKLQHVIVHKHHNMLLDQTELSVLLASGMKMAAYKFDKYFTKKEDDKKESDRSYSINIITNDLDKANKHWAENLHELDGVFLARNFVSEPPNMLYPESYAQKIVEELDGYEDIEVEVLGEREMKNLGMGAILGVGQGSQRESKMVIIKYNGDGQNPYVSLVGKGVTFDSGGISLKPSDGMQDMKYDMAGSAAVVGAMKTLAARKAKVNVVGAVGLVENMPSGSAQRPADVVYSMSGKTVQVDNTDAEGRLVLADVVWYVQEKYNPTKLITIATLTGAIVVALGPVYSGCFCKDDELLNQITLSGKEIDEEVWPMPLHDAYQEAIKSDIADVRNISNMKGAGSSTAAHFIGSFIKEKTKWAHIDIAGVAWNYKGSFVCPKGATGYGVRLFNRWIKNFYEN